MSDFTVECDYGGILPLISKVYSVDSNKFLITDGVGQFFWVDMNDCRLVKED